jgi:DNA-binding response OmpR family regulator
MGTENEPTRERPLRIVIVEDDRDVAELLAEIVIESGHVAAIVSNAETLAAALEAMPVDLLLLDLESPVMNCREVARHARDRCGRHVWIVAAISEPDHRARALEAGCDDVIVMPYHRDTVIGVLTAASEWRARNEG